MKPNRRSFMPSSVKVRRANGHVALNPALLTPPVNACLPIYRNFVPPVAGPVSLGPVVAGVLGRCSASFLGGDIVIALAGCLPEPSRDRLAQRVQGKAVSIEPARL